VPGLFEFEVVDEVVRGGEAGEPILREPAEQRVVRGGVVRVVEVGLLGANWCVGHV